MKKFGFRKAKNSRDGQEGSPSVPPEDNPYARPLNTASPQKFSAHPYDSPPHLRGPGGYGGLESNDTNCAELFGSPAQRPAQQQLASQTSGFATGNTRVGGYGSYDDRQLTQEEQEEEASCAFPHLTKILSLYQDIQATKSEIEFLKQQDVSSTQNALRLARQAEETGRQTLSRLGEQGERIHNTERNLDLTSSQNRIAEEKTRELKTVNRSMFAMHISNPFTSTSRREAREAALLDTHKRERVERNATRAEVWSSRSRQNAAKFTAGDASGGRPSGRNLAERAKYQFEADSEDDAREDKIEGNLDAIHGVTSSLKHLAGAMREEIESQNRHIGGIIKKTDRVDDQIALNRARLDRIH